MTPARTAAIWSWSPPDLSGWIDRLLDAVPAETGTDRETVVFFRADDAGVDGKQFDRLMDTFSAFQVPLALAVVPTWLTPQRWERIERRTASRRSLWCWHQHGWRHVNHESEGKKMEFGPGRTRDQVRHDLLRGRERLEGLLGDDFLPVFTPPWNRCSVVTLELLRELGYRAVSRNHGSRPDAPDGLPDVQVHVDLHTRKDVGPEVAWKNLELEILAALASGRCGFMIHHRLMNDVAFGFLERLLAALAGRRGLRLGRFTDLW